MTPAELYYEGWVNRSDHTVYGYILRPLCLADLVAIEALGSPLGKTGASVRPFDLAVVSRLLSRPASPHTIDPNIVENSLVLRWKLRRYNFREQLAAFEAYWNDYYTPVEMYRSTGGGQEVGSHWAEGVAVYILRNTNVPIDFIWTAPIGRVLSLRAALEEQISGGSSRVKTDADIAVEREAEENAKTLDELKAKEINAIKDALSIGGLEADERVKLVRRLSRLEGHIL